MVYKAVKVMKETMESHRYCDVCGDEIDISLMCYDRDLCEKCIAYDIRLLRA